MQIRVEHLTKRYRDADHDLTVINNLSYTFPEKGSVAIVGRSGTGKSTLMHLLGGLDMPTSGRVLFGDHDFSRMSSDERAAFRARHIGFIFQFHHLLPEFSALENVSLPLTMEGCADGEAESRASELLERVGLAARARHLPSQLSGGEQQRVAIARALVARPSVVLADEPTGNLDVATAAAIQSMLVEMTQAQGSTLVVVTHNQELARGLDNAVEMMPGGSLVEWSKR